MRLGENGEMFPAYELDKKAIELSGNALDKALLLIRMIADELGVNVRTLVAGLNVAKDTVRHYECCIDGKQDLMTLDDYQRLAQRTANETEQEKKLDNGILGLCGEVGEIADQIKKYRHQGHDLDRGHMIEELGDVLWYCAELAAGLGTTLDQAAEANVEKLRARYPDGFDAERSRNRE